MTLPELITLFAREHSRLEDAREAWGECDTMSHRFIAFAREHGHLLGTYAFDANSPNNPAPEWYNVDDETGGRLVNDAGCKMCSWHCVVDAGECLIDFTARQYQTPEHPMPFPLIIPMNKAMGAHA